MAPYTTFRPSSIKPTKEQIAQLTTAYAKHRPLAQRVLTIGFVTHILSSFVRNFSGRSALRTRSKGKAKAGDKKQSGKSPRVAVRLG